MHHRVFNNEINLYVQNKTFFGQFYINSEAFSEASDIHNIRFHAVSVKIIPRNL